MEPKIEVGTLLDKGHPTKIKLKSETTTRVVCIEKMGQKEWWLLLIEKNAGDECLFEKHQVGDEILIIPSTKLEKTETPQEAEFDMETIIHKQILAGDVHKKFAELSPKAEELTKEIRSLIAIGFEKEGRSEEETAALEEKKKLRESIIGKIIQCQNIMGDAERTVIDLTIKWKKLVNS